MAKPSALLLLLLSSLAVSSCEAQDRFLTPEEIRDAETVSAWFAAHGGNAANDEATFFLDLAERAKHSEDWSAATKAFGEAMIRYPSPKAIAGYADAQLRMLGMVRARNRSFDAHAGRDTKEAFDYYRSAMAANAVLETLDAQSRKDLQNKIDCLAGYAAHGNRTAQCSPLRAYFDAGAK